MKKILDILIVVALTLLIVNLFNGNKEQKASGEIEFSPTKSSYTIPVELELEVKNNSADTLTLNTCDNIALTRSGTPVVLSKEFCKDIAVESGEKAIIDYGSEYATLSEVGKYLFEITYADKKDIAVFEVENKGAIKKIFTTLFYAPIYNLMIAIIKVLGGELGWGIIGVTILIRIFLLWPQHRMMLSQKKLQTLQPKIKEIQEKYKGDSQNLGVKMMELYKKEKVNPLGSCGFLLIQMPILLVLYNVILSFKDPSNQYHLYSFLSNYDISAIDFNFFGLELLEAGGITGVVLAISIAVIQFTQVKLSLAGKEVDKSKPVLEKKKGATDYNQFMPDPEMMNKFMLYGMPAMVAVFTFTLFAGVGVYWGISTTFMVLQQLIVNKVLKK